MTTGARTGRGLTISAMLLAVLLGLVAVMFTAGEILADPGGWRGVGLIALWLVPLSVLLVLALTRPSPAQRVLEALTAVWLVAALWPHAWRSFERGNGPVRAVVCLVLVLPVAALGWHRPLRAGVLLLVIGVGAVAAGGSAPLRVLALPAVVIGAVLLAAALAGHGHQQGTAATGPRP